MVRLRATNQGGQQVAQPHTTHNRHKIQKREPDFVERCCQQIFRECCPICDNAIDRCCNLVERVLIDGVGLMCLGPFYIVFLVLCKQFNGEKKKNE